MLKHRGKDIDSSEIYGEVCRTRLDPVEMVSILTAIRGNSDFPGIEETCGPW